MTTVAWDGNQLAGDRLARVGDTPLRTKKVWRLRAPNGRIALLGTSGQIAFTTQYRYWLAGGEKPEAPKDANWALMMIDDQRVVWYRNDKTDAWDRFGRTQWAIGSGCDYALGAMCAGATSREAVLISAKMDVGTGKGVDVVGFW